MKLQVFFMIVIIALFSFQFFVEAEVMSSTNYKIQADSVNVGGVRQTSNSYISEDTIGESGPGTSSSTNYSLKAGYQEMIGGYYISISVPVNVDLGTIVGTGDTGLTGASANWSVITDNPGGYKLEWQASSTNMVSGSDVIGPYTPAIADTPEVWSVASTDSEWGGRLSASSTDTAIEWGSLNEVAISAKWLNVASAAARQIVSRASANHPVGSDEKIFFRVEVGTSKVQSVGEYHTGITITTTAL